MENTVIDGVGWYLSGNQRPHLARARYARRDFDERPQDAAGSLVVMRKMSLLLLLLLFSAAGDLNVAALRRKRHARDGSRRLLWTRRRQRKSVKMNAFLQRLFHGFSARDVYVDAFCYFSFAFLQTIYLP